MIGLSVVKDVAAKVQALKVPKGFSCRPILIHVNGVSDEVVDSDYFAATINVSNYLDAP